MADSTVAGPASSIAARGVELRKSDDSVKLKEDKSVTAAVTASVRGAANSASANLAAKMAGSKPEVQTAAAPVVSRLGVKSNPLADATQAFNAVARSAAFNVAPTGKPVPAAFESITHAQVPAFTGMTPATILKSAKFVEIGAPGNATKNDLPLVAPRTVPYSAQEKANIGKHFVVRDHAMAMTLVQARAQSEAIKNSPLNQFLRTPAGQATMALAMKALNARMTQAKAGSQSLEASAGLSDTDQATAKAVGNALSSIISQMALPSNGMVDGIPTDIDGMLISVMLSDSSEVDAELTDQIHDMQTILDQKKQARTIKETEEKDKAAIGAQEMDEYQKACNGKLIDPTKLSFADFQAARQVNYHTPTINPDGSVHMIASTLADPRWDSSIAAVPLAYRPTPPVPALDPTVAQLSADFDALKSADPGLGPNWTLQAYIDWRGTHPSADAGTVPGAKDPAPAPTITDSTSVTQVAEFYGLPQDVVQALSDYLAKTGGGSVGDFLKNQPGIAQSSYYGGISGGPPIRRPDDGKDAAVKNLSVVADFLAKDKSGAANAARDTTASYTKRPGYSPPVADQATILAKEYDLPIAVVTALEPIAGFKNEDLGTYVSELSLSRGDGAKNLATVQSYLTKIQTMLKTADGSAFDADSKKFDTAIGLCQSHHDSPHFVATPSFSDPNDVNAVAAYFGLPVDVVQGLVPFIAATGQPSLADYLTAICSKNSSMQVNPASTDPGLGQSNLEALENNLRTGYPAEPTARDALGAALPYDGLGSGPLSDQLVARIAEETGLPPEMVTELKAYYNQQVASGQLPASESFNTYLFGPAKSGDGGIDLTTSLHLQIGNGNGNGWSMMSQNLARLNTQGMATGSAVPAGLKAEMTNLSGESEAQYYSDKYGIPVDLVNEALKVFGDRHGLLGKSLEDVLTSVRDSEPNGITASADPAVQKQNVLNMYNRLFYLASQDPASKDDLASLQTDINKQYPNLINDPSKAPDAPDPVPQITPQDPPPGVQLVTIGMMQANIDAADDELQNLNALGEIQQLKLQTLTDQRQKVIETLSNLIKKEGDLLKTISDNTRG